MYLVKHINDNYQGMSQDPIFKYKYINVYNTSEYTVLIKLIWPSFSDILHNLLINQYDNIIHGKRKTIDLIISCPIAWLYKSHPGVTEISCFFWFSLIKNNECAKIILIFHSCLIPPFVWIGSWTRKTHWSEFYV